MEFFRIPERIRSCGIRCSSMPLGPHVPDRGRFPIFRGLNLYIEFTGGNRDGGVPYRAPADLKRSGPRFARLGWGTSVQSFGTASGTDDPAAPAPGFSSGQQPRSLMTVLTPEPSPAKGARIRRSARGLCGVR